MSKRFTLAVWTATMAYNARKIVNDVFTVNQIPLLFVWYNDMCVAHDSEGNVLHSNAAAAGMAAAAAAWSERSRTLNSQVIPQATLLSAPPCSSSSSYTVPIELADTETVDLTASPGRPVTGSVSHPIVLAPSPPMSPSGDKNTSIHPTHSPTRENGDEYASKNEIENQNESGKDAIKPPTTTVQFQRDLQVENQLPTSPGGSILDNSKNGETQSQQNFYNSGPIMVKPLSMVWNMFPVYSKDNTVR